MVFGSNPPATIFFSASPPSQAAYTCAQPPAPATFDTIDIQIQTGNDNADQNLDITAILDGPSSTVEDILCLKPSNDSSLSFPQGPAAMGKWGNCSVSSSAPSWGNGFVFDLTTSAGIGPIKLPHPLTPQQLAATTMRIRALQSGCSLSCSNWDIQAISVVLSDSTKNLSPTTLTIGTIVVGSGWKDSNCIARLKAPPNATAITFGLGNPSQGTPPPPIMYLTYWNGNEAGQPATCQDSGDGGAVP